MLIYPLHIGQSALVDHHYEYVAWLRDPQLDPEDQDYEWPAVFVVVSDDGESATAWGDQLSKAYADRSGQVLLSSTVELIDPAAVRDLRTVRVGDINSDPFV